MHSIERTSVQFCLYIQTQYTAANANCQPHLLLKEEIRLFQRVQQLEHRPTAHATLIHLNTAREPANDPQGFPFPILEPEDKGMLARSVCLSGNPFSTPVPSTHSPQTDHNHLARRLRQRFLKFLSRLCTQHDIQHFVCTDIPLPLFIMLETRVGEYIIEGGRESRMAMNRG